MTRKKSNSWDFTITEVMRQTPHPPPPSSPVLTPKRKSHFSKSFTFLTAAFKQILIKTFLKIAKKLCISTNCFPYKENQVAWFLQGNILGNYQEHSIYHTVYQPNRGLLLPRPDYQLSKGGAYPGPLDFWSSRLTVCQLICADLMETLPGNK